MEALVLPVPQPLETDSLDKIIPRLAAEDRSVAC